MKVRVDVEKIWEVPGKAMNIDVFVWFNEEEIVYDGTTIPLNQKLLEKYPCLGDLVGKERFYESICWMDEDELREFFKDLGLDLEKLERE